MAKHKVSKFVMCMALTLGTSAPWMWAAPGTPGGPQRGAYLGVIVDNVPAETAAALHLSSGGTAIANVDQDGPACQAGLKGGDIVTAFNGKPVSGPEQFAGLIQGSAPGNTVTLTVLRNGHSQEMKVKLGSWKQMAAVPPLPPRAPLSPVGTMPFAPPAPVAPLDMDIHAYTPMVLRSGIVVEPLSPQLSDFFGVPPNQGVLVRSVERGSPGAAAGLKAGDVILRVNNEAIHDMQDWKRALKAPGGKVSMSVVRDKRQQSLQMNLPASTSQMQGGDWDNLERDAPAMAAEMQQLGPEFERNAQEMAALAQLDQSQIEEINRQAQAAAQSVTPEMKKQAEKMRKQAVVIRQQSEQMRKEVEKMTPEMARTAKDMADSMKPTAKELNDMARDMAQQWKEMQPELQKEMQEFKKEMEQEQREWQEIFKGSDTKQQF